MICNENICLRPLSLEDTNFVLELRNDLDDSLSYFSDYPLYDFEHIDWLKKKEKDIDMIIEYKGQRVGRVRITNIDYRNQKCEFGIHIHKNFRGMGLAYKAGSIIIDYVFRNLPIRKIYLYTMEENVKAVKLFQKLGFVIEGTLIEEVFKDGKWRNVLRMAIFRQDSKN
ncbi:MAG: GNAT family N-acetyltransferase [Fervidobacterium sp.]|nr:GNAT family N-acetyltransferase [Fervidobacterium sp.]